MSFSRSARPSNEDVKLRRPVQNEEDFETVFHEVAGDLLQNGPGTARVVSRPPVLSERTRRDLRQMRTNFSQQYGPQILSMAEECRAAMRAGHRQVLQFFSEVTRDCLADGYSWSAVFFLIFLVLAILAAVGFGMLASGVVPIIWRAVRGFITAQ
ncbi:uncharacterized protein LOC121420438 [Lytechinus variegatus]|uniref:uncharacterized protein LOC121420438 n=1 Tax=Lytechinus variegatus TaxID=7654 RepID=UPI001BB10479|nr:uncharacterized protein LOC121420438 [Lytechinus variegatus]XP_041471007.1 uncharacterized protein LOC121420438 [Lytechinus variegatus]